MSGGVNRRVIEEFRENEGRVGGPLADTPILLIHHVGARSRTARVTPVAYLPQVSGRYVIAASNGGSPDHPAWYHDLTSNPTIDVEVGGRTHTVVAEEIEGPARDEAWSELVAAFPSVGEFQARTARRIPVFVLTPA